MTIWVICQLGFQAFGTRIHRHPLDEQISVTDGNALVTVQPPLPHNPPPNFEKYGEEAKISYIYLTVKGWHWKDESKRSDQCFFTRRRDDGGSCKQWNVTRHKHLSSYVRSHLFANFLSKISIVVCQWELLRVRLYLRQSDIREISGSKAQEISRNYKWELKEFWILWKVKDSQYA